MAGASAASLSAAEIARQMQVRVPNPGTVAERNVMAASQPGFLSACRAGVNAARAASCADTLGNATHSAVQHWGRFTIIGLKVEMRRPLDPMSTPLERKLEEVDLVDAFGWWLVSQVGVNTETAWSYVCTVNAWHERTHGVGLAAGFSLDRVHKMLLGMQRLAGQPVTRRRRVGIRPAHLRSGIDARLNPRGSAADANKAALMETALVALARAAEVAASRARTGFVPARHPSRRDVRFEFTRGELTGCTIWIVNCKARGAGYLQKLPVYLPIDGKYLSPGRALYYLVRVADQVPYDQEPFTPLFRDPATNQILTVASVRECLRSCMVAIGRDPTVYGAHSLRIGGATALAWLRVPGEDIQAAGRWHSDSYMRYIRERRSQAMAQLAAVAGADTDDFEADFVDIDLHGFDDEDEE